MKQFTVTSEGFKKFILYDHENKELGTLTYPKWYSLDAEIFTDKALSEIIMEGFWQSKMVQYNANYVKKRTIKNSWKGFKINDESGKKYFFTGNNVWDAEYVLLDEEKNELLTLKSESDWKKSTSKYTLKVKDNLLVEHDLMLVMVHCKNFLESINTLVIMA